MKGTSYYVDHAVRRVVEHPDYSSRKLFHDVALVELKEQVEMRRNIQVRQSPSQIKCREGILVFLPYKSLLFNHVTCNIQTIYT